MRRMERLYRRNSSARPSRLTLDCSHVALPERPRMQLARIPPTRSQLRRPDRRECLRVPAQGGEGCSMATRAAAARLPTRPERPGQLGAAHRSGSREAERNRHARDIPGWRAARSVEPARAGGARRRSARPQRSCLPRREAHRVQEGNVRECRDGLRSSMRRRYACAAGKKRTK